MTVAGYERPATVDEALALLARPGTVALGGGTTLNAAGGGERVVLVDLQALGLDRIERAPDGLVSLGGSVTLQELVEDGDLPAAVREAARRELPSTLRTAATVGGCVAGGDPESELLAVLLVHDARVDGVGRDGVETLPLDVLLDDPALLAGRIVTGVTIDVSGVSAVERTARTPADRAIVAAAARRTPAGEQRLALTGVASRPVLVASVDELDPPGDFRGSSEYRSALAAVLARRALEAVE